ncbi:hypothetical protein AB4Y45_34030 [Paraburkholderia sp. EG287A]|uniref:hypothetical protein n=1 Tax=Paraburkholderia sp. EG287A TaxID=3237012 RepID=UPI0034D33769
MTTEVTLKLSLDKNAVALRQLQSVSGAVSTIFSIIKDGTAIERELATNCLKVAEFELSHLGKTLGIETDSAKEREQRYADLRAANARVRELEALLGSTQPPEATQAALKNLADQLNGWWDLEGFGHISDIAFGQYGCTVNFSCNLFGTFRLVDSDTPVSDKDRKKRWYESLQERGFVLVDDDREWSVCDCDASRKVLQDLIVGRMPSAKILKFENQYRTRASGFILRGAEVFISKIEEIRTLPVPPKKEKQA